MTDYDLLADWIEERDHFGTLQPASPDDVASMRVASEWTELDVEFPPAPPRSVRCRRATSRREHLQAWLDALEAARFGNVSLIHHIKCELGIADPRPWRSSPQSPKHLTANGPAESIEWEAGDFIPPMPPRYKPTASALPRQVDAMHWLTVMQFLCGLDEELGDRLAALRQTFLW